MTGMKALGRALALIVLLPAFVVIGASVGLAVWGVALSGGWKVWRDD